MKGVREQRNQGTIKKRRSGNKERDELQMIVRFRCSNEKKVNHIDHINKININKGGEIQSNTRNRILDYD